MSRVMDQIDQFLDELAESVGLKLIVIGNHQYHLANDDGVLGPTDEAIPFLEVLAECLFRHIAMENPQHDMDEIAAEVDRRIQAFVDYGQKLVEQ